MICDDSHGDLTDLVRHLEDEIGDLELLIEMMALALVANEMPERQRTILERILS